MILLATSFPTLCPPGWWQHRSVPKPVWWSLGSSHPTPASRRRKKNPHKQDTCMSGTTRVKRKRVRLHLTMKIICPRSPMGLKYMMSYWSQRWGMTTWDPIRPTKTPRVKKHENYSVIAVHNQPSQNSSYLNINKASKAFLGAHFNVYTYISTLFCAHPVCWPHIGPESQWRRTRWRRFRWRRSGLPSLWGWWHGAASSAAPWWLTRPTTPQTSRCLWVQSFKKQNKAYT